MMMTPDSNIASASIPFEFHNESGRELPLDEARARRIAGMVMAVESASGTQLLELVYVDEDEILRINRAHLQHDYVTDIITFSYHEPGEPVEATLFCCASRISGQAGELHQVEKTEFERVLIHGLLHACGYNDVSPEEKSRMTALENHYLKRSTELHQH